MNRSVSSDNTVPHSSSIKPETIRLPKPGCYCRISGLSRTALYELCKKGKIRSAVLLQPGKGRGIRLIEYDSLVGFLRSLFPDDDVKTKDPQTNPGAI
jgi:hypothetical protein